MESDNLLVRLFFFFFFVHDNEADYFLSSDGRVGKNEFTDVSFHAGFFFLRLEIGFVHKPPTVPKVFFTYLQSSILVFFPSLFSISTVLLCLPCPRTLTFFHLSLLFFPRSVLLLFLSLSLVISYLFARFIPTCIAVILTFSPEKVSLGSRLIRTVSRNSETNSWREGLKR